jgi:DNA polymerase-3 subunit epsilon
MQLRETKFAAIDLETTGLNLKGDEILAVGIVPMDGTKILANEAYYTLINPKKFKIDTIKIHGLDPSGLKDAPRFEDVAGEIYRKIKDRILVGYAVEIDISFLKRALSDAGYELKNKYIDIIQVELALNERLGERYAWEDLTLDTLIRRYSIKSSFRHNALADAFFAAQIFQIQLVKIIKYGINTFEKFEEFLKISHTLSRDRSRIGLF